MFKNHIIGMPLIGKNRELKFAIENYVYNRNTSNLNSLRDISKRIIRWNIKMQLHSLDIITIGTFCYPDPVTYTTILLGLVNRDYISEYSMFDTVFNITRGFNNLPAFSMTKWFGTNFHYFKPSKHPNYNFITSLNFINYEISLLSKLGLSNIKFSIIGPFTICLMIGFSSKNSISLLLSRYNLLLSKLLVLGIKYIQAEEPLFNDCLSKHSLQIYKYIYSRIDSRLKVIFTSYFSMLNANIKYINTYGLHIDIVNNNDIVNSKLIRHFKFLSFGIIPGNNVWISNFKRITTIFKSSDPNDIIFISPNCSFRHIPYDLNSETNKKLLPNIFLSFLVQKLSELVSIKNILNRNYLYKNIYIRNTILNKKFIKYSRSFINNSSHFSQRKKKRTKFDKLGIGLLPLTTIGSFPQTNRVRSLRKMLDSKQLSPSRYRDYIFDEIHNCYKFQYSNKVDLLTNGEIERNDMVQYFCKFLEGCLITNNGWVNSYCTRCVKPPIMYGGLTIKNFNNEYKYIKILNSINLKYIITGPITLTKWSYININLDISNVIFSISNSIRSIVLDVYNLGIRFIQIDEPAIVEFIDYYSLYYDYSYISSLIINSFRFCYSDVVDKNIQIHTHICYSRYSQNMVNLLKSMGFDKVSFESSRNLSHILDFVASNSLLKYFDIGFGLYDVHSSNVPSIAKLTSSVNLIINKVGFSNVWINPDCGLKTRSYKEVSLFLKNINYVLTNVRNKIRSSKNS
ncbi:hypothetical protein JSR06_00175 [Candidatus Vidania fulgoroideae]|uniref:5-methyltetrahydropteroyltriglutamate--homocysteine S-methyltransferase n=1 Tax=Candidatus Vidania fulgoroideorum TaxID=881286 RepID=A0A974X9D2_9PROT|nr:hypothetical protein JSR06_00175 [Candidatus Vidania fulgoroideae]